jgi:hypothetical protein
MGMGELHVFNRRLPAPVAGVQRASRRGS